eukprot:TRINITY_DN35077_c0_g1_i1.p1 TRINITY_DN35077_c0_g1~~TRINITY_DN35077_c0_g1_i1.p1  ORF type:complete len:259 (+),score=104.48 TRINITY_DN35077_c0_g1_i1:83-859(+)
MTKDWSVDVDSGTLAGWDVAVKKPAAAASGGYGAGDSKEAPLATAEAAAPAAAAKASTGASPAAADAKKEEAAARAEDLFADRSATAGASNDTAAPEAAAAAAASSDAAAAGNGGEDDDSSSEDEEDERLKALLKQADEELAVDTKVLRELLRDNGEFMTACEEAFKFAGGKIGVNGKPIETVEQLQKAMNHLCRRCVMEELDEEETMDIYDGPMDGGVFYQLAREYFDSLCHTLAMSVGFDDEAAEKYAALAPPITE